jgi:translation initiation factor IF-3
VLEEVALGEAVEQAGDEEEDGVEVIQMAPVPVCAMASISLI